MEKSIKNKYLLAFALLFLAVLLGAFGTHGLAQKLTPKLMNTYKTGVTYQFYHSIALVMVLMLKNMFPALNIRPTANLFLLGILLFSFNCYIYAVTSIKTFAMIVPFGGLSFLVGWILLIINFSKVQK